MKTKYGDILRIHGCCEQGGNKSKKGLVVSKGFTSDNVYYQTQPHLILINNYRDSLFEILPKGSFEIHDEFQKLLFSDSFKKLDEKEQTFLLQRLKSEKNKYMNLIQIKLSEEVCFGSEVVLRHYDSGEYLIASKNCNEYNTNTFTVKLSKELTSKAIFQIFPFKSYQKIGYSIYYQEKILILSHHKKFYLDFVEQNITEDEEIEIEKELIKSKNIDKEFIKPLKQMEKVIKTPEKLCKQYQLVLSQSQNLQWQFKSHQTLQEIQESTMIAKYSLVSFQYTLNEAYLSVNMKTNEVILKEAKEKNYIPLDAYWEIQPCNKNIANKEIKYRKRNSLFVTRTSNQRISLSKEKTVIIKSKKDITASVTPKKLKYNHNEVKFILRHFVTGKILAFNPKKKKQIKVGKYNSDETKLVSIEFAKLGDLQLKPNAYVYLSYEQQLIQISSRNKKTNAKDAKLSLLDINEKTYNLILSESYVNAFQITQINHYDKINMLFVLSGQELLNKFIQILHKPQNEIYQLLNYKFLASVYELLAQLIGYLQNSNIQLEDFQQKPMKYRQKTFQDLQITNQLLQIIALCSHRDLIFTNQQYWKSEREKLRKIFLQIYQLIKMLSYQNQPIKMHISEYIELFLHQVIVIDEEIIQNSIKELLNENLEAIATYITEDTIRNLIDKLFEMGPNQKYLKILSLLCGFKNIAVPTNQNHVIAHFFKKNHPNFGFDFRSNQRTNSIEILCHELDKVLKLDELIVKYSSHWNYILGYINLLADVCINQNSQGLRLAQQILPTQILITIIETLQDQQALDCFLKLLDHYYVKTIPLKRNDKIIDWESIENSQLKKNNDLLQYQELQRVSDFVQQYMENLQTLEDIENSENNGILIRVLSIIKTILETDFWNNIEGDLQPLTKNILKIYNLKKNISDWRVLCLEILELLIDYDTSIRLDKMIKTFKQQCLGQIEIKAMQSQNKFLEKLLKMLRFNNQSSQPSQSLESPRKIDKFSIKDLSKIKEKKLISQWIDIFQDFMQKSELFKNLPQQIDIELIQNPTYNPIIFANTIRIFKKLYSQSSILLQEFQKLIFLDQQQGIVNKLSEKVISFIKLIKQIDTLSIKQFTREEKFFNYLKTLSDWCSFLKTSPQDRIYDLEQPDGPKFRIILNELDQNDKLYQQIFIAYDIHNNIIDVIKVIHKLDYFDEKILQLLDISYEFLTLLIWNCPQNQQQMQMDLSILFKEYNNNLYCLDFLREMARNNKQILFSESIVKDIVKFIINKIKTQIMEENEQQKLKQIFDENFQKIKLIDILRVLTYDDQHKSIKQNQFIILSYFNKSKNRIINYYPNQKKKESLWNEANFIQEMKLYQENYQKLESEIYIQSTLMYMVKYFELFSMLIENNIIINIEKCRALHSYQWLLYLLENSFNCWPLQRFVRAYLNRLYYRTLTEDSISELFITKDLQIIVTQLDLIINYIYSKKLYQKNIQIINGVRFSYLFTYVFGNLEEIYFTLNELLINENFLNEFEKIISQSIYEYNFNYHFLLFSLMQQVQEVKKLWFKSDYIMNFSEKLNQILNLILEKIIPYETRQQILIKFENEKNLNNEKRKQNFVQFLKKETIDNAKQAPEEQSEEQLQNAIRKMLRIKSDKLALSQKAHDKKRAQINLNHHTIIETLKNNKDFQIYIENEFNNLFRKMDLLSDTSQQNNQKEVINKFFSGIINMNIENPDCLNDELKIFFLDVLIKKISCKNMNNEVMNLPIDQWQPDEMTDQCKQLIEQEQNFLDQCGAATLIFQMFVEANILKKWKLIHKLLIFTNAFLLNGNTKTQNSLLKLIKKDQHNLMFQNLKKLITMVSSYIITNFKSKKNKESKKSKELFKCEYLDYADQFCSQTQTLKKGFQQYQKQLSLQYLMDLIRSAFRMLQLLCENNNIEMKDYLRVQTDKDNYKKQKQINFVEFATKQFRRYLKRFNEEFSNIEDQIIEFINEVIQVPALNNQQTLCKSTYFQDVSFIKSDVKVMSKILQTILLVLEGNQIENYEELQNKLDVRFLIKFIKKKKIDMTEKSNRMIFSNELQYFFEVFIIIKKIALKTPNSHWIKEINSQINSNKDLTEKRNFIEKNLMSIEIYYQGNSQIIFFPFHPVFQFLNNDTKSQIMFSAPRDTQRDKLCYIMSKLSEIKIQTEHHFKLNSFIIPITNRTMNQLYQICLALSVLVNLYIIYSYDVQIKNGESIFQTTVNESLTLEYLSILQLISSLIVFIMYILIHIRLELKNLQTKIQNQKDQKNYIFLKKIWLRVMAIFQTDDFIQHLVFLIFSFVGVFQNPYYFSVHLFYIVARNPLLNNVFQAISHNAKQLLMVTALGVIFQFVFSNLTLEIYLQDIEFIDGQKCESILTCMITIMTSGVIGQPLDVWDAQKFFYDTIYYVFFGLLFTNIISGIMIDTFAELRDYKQKILDDQTNFCYICGIDRSALSKQQIKFKDHIKNYHFLWNYIFYLQCLEYKDSTEFTGLEYWIRENVAKDKIVWFPLIEQNQIDLEKEMAIIFKKLDNLKQYHKQQNNKSLNDNI